MSINWIVFALTIINLAVAVGLYVRMEDKFSIFDTISHSQGQIFKESLNKTFENYKEMYDIYHKQIEMTDLIYAQYKDIYKTQLNLLDQHNKILECWREIDNHYTDTCEQFEQIGKGIADIYSVVYELNKKHEPIAMFGPEETDDDFEKLIDETDNTMMEEKENESV